MLLALGFVACSEKGSEALERELSVMEEAGASNAELCAKAHQVADAYLAEENRSDYEIANSQAATYCAGAQLDRLEGR